MPEHFKYPRTMHLPFSLGTHSDDRLLTEPEMIEMFAGKEVVVTEKLDGENSSIYRDYIHARSLDGRHHPSQNCVRQLQGNIGHEIPEGWRVCAENLFGKHSIFYDRLPSFVFVFSIWNEKNECLSWDETKQYSEMLGLPTVPELYVGPWNLEKVKACWTGKSNFGEEQEGYVVRWADGFPYPVPGTEKHESVFFKTIAKFVRAKHVKTTDHWRKNWTPNQLAV